MVAKKTRSKDMRWRVTLQRRIETIARDGGRTESWTDYADVWAAVSESRFSYQRTSDAPHGWSMKDFTIYYDAQINLKDFCIIYNERRYRLSAISQNNEWARYMTLTGEGNLLEKVT